MPHGGTAQHRVILIDSDAGTDDLYFKYYEY